MSGGEGVGRQGGRNLEIGVRPYPGERLLKIYIVYNNYTYEKIRGLLEEYKGKLRQIMLNLSFYLNVIESRLPLHLDCRQSP